MAQTDKTLCQRLLKKGSPLSKDSLFNDDLFEIICEALANRNETRVIQNIGRLIVLASKELFHRGAKHLKYLIETADEGWIKSISLVKGPRPQPDFVVGLKPSAFTSAQLKKLQPSIGDWQTLSRLVATDEMYFPFLTSEVKCGNEALNIADRQNAHTAAVAASAVVELYRLVSRQDQLNRRILTFSISHDNEAVRIYGHYALITEQHTRFYRHPIKKFDFISEDGKEKWIPYTFTRNVYDKFFPIITEDFVPPLISYPTQKTSLWSPSPSNPNLCPSNRTAANRPPRTLDRQNRNLSHLRPLNPCPRDKRREPRSNCVIWNMRKYIFVLILIPVKRYLRSVKSAGVSKKASKARANSLCLSSCSGLLPLCGERTGSLLGVMVAYIL